MLNIQGIPDDTGGVTAEVHIDEVAVLRAAPDPVFVIDSDIVLRYTNPAGEELLGYRQEEWLGRSMLEMVHPSDVAHILSSSETVLEKPVGTPVETRVRTAGGTWKWVEIVGRASLATPGVDGIVIVARDVTQRRMWEVASNDTVKFQQVLQLSPSITLLLDRDGVVSSVNAAFTRLLGHDMSRVIGHPLADFCVEGAEHELRHALERATAASRPVTCEAEMRTVDAEAPSRPIRFEIVNLLDDPVVAGLVVTAHDVSDLHSARRTLEHLARHDTLTGLANRSVLLEQLEAHLAGDRPAAVVFIDLDRFKPVNDLLGHEAGDELLRVVADRLRQVVRPGDLVARVGGDEFVVLARDVVDRRTGQLLAERIEATLSMPYLLTEGPVRVSASVGVALTDEDTTVTGALADADLAMYEAKAARRGEPVRSAAHRHRNANQRRRLADDLATGLPRGEVVAYLQPVISLATGTTVGLEALARWHHPDLGVLSPIAFLDLAEDAGLDLLLGDMVLHSACATMAPLDSSLRIGLNLSVGQLADRQLCDRMRGILSSYDLSPERLVIEITEHATLTRRAGAGRVSPEHTIDELRQMGTTLCLDDFGTGYSSLTHIRRYPLSTIKIDRSFVSGVCHHGEDRAVVGAVVGLAKALGVNVVAEGVETMDQLAALTEIGCDLAQGHLFALPLAPSEVAGWLARYGADWRGPMVRQPV